MKHPGETADEPVTSLSDLLRSIELRSQKIHRDKILESHGNASVYRPQVVAPITDHRRDIQYLEPLQHSIAAQAEDPYTLPSNGMSRIRNEEDADLVTLNAPDASMRLDPVPRKSTVEKELEKLRVAGAKVEEDKARQRSLLMAKQSNLQQGRTANSVGGQPRRIKKRKSKSDAFISKNKKDKPA
jgi:hypothetical protein